MLFSALALGAESHVCDTHTCDTTARTAQELRNTCPSGQDGMIKQFTHFSSTGTSTGCYQSGSNLYAVGGPHWGGGHCAWTSEKVQITHPHEFEQLYVKFQSADYGNLESTDYQQVELRTCKANNMQACSPWSRTVHVNDDVHGWTWTWINSDAKTATSSRQQNVFADKVGWTARNTPVKQDEGFVQARLVLKVTDDWHSERLIADNLQIWGDCYRDEARGICHQETATTHSCSCRAGYQCSGADCTTCAAPTPSPTQSPTPSPTKAPTNAPTNAPTLKLGWNLLKKNTQGNNVDVRDTFTPFQTEAIRVQKNSAMASKSNGWFRVAEIDAYGIDGQQIVVTGAQTDNYYGGWRKSVWAEELFDDSTRWGDDTAVHFQNHATLWFGNAVTIKQLRFVQIPHANNRYNQANWEWQFYHGKFYPYGKPQVPTGWELLKVNTQGNNVDVRDNFTPFQTEAIRVQKIHPGTQVTHGWFRVAEIDAYGTDGQQIVPVSARTDNYHGAWRNSAWAPELYDDSTRWGNDHAVHFQNHATLNFGEVVTIQQLRFVQIPNNNNQYNQIQWMWLKKELQPIQCEFHYDWTTCTNACGTGTRTSTRVIDVEGMYGGECSAEESTTQDCNTEECEGEFTLDLTFDDFSASDEAALKETLAETFQVNVADITFDAESVQWLMGGPSRPAVSCDAACSNAGKVCDQASLDGLTDLSSMKAAYAAAGKTCTSWPDHCSSGNNCVNWGAPYVHNNHFHQGICWVGFSPSAAPCAQVPVDHNHRRLCPCMGSRRLIAAAARTIKVVIKAATVTELATFKAVESNAETFAQTIVTKMAAKGQTIAAPVVSNVVAAVDPAVVPNATPFPTNQPTKYPTKSPTPQPTYQPTNQPTNQPTESPTEQPSAAPTPAPTPHALALALALAL